MAMPMQQPRVGPAMPMTAGAPPAPGGQPPAGPAPSPPQETAETNPIVGAFQTLMAFATALEQRGDKRGGAIKQHITAMAQELGKPAEKPAQAPATPAAAPAAKPAPEPAYNKSVDRSSVQMGA